MMSGWIIFGSVFFQPTSNSPAAMRKNRTRHDTPRFPFYFYHTLHPFDFILVLSRTLGPHAYFAKQMPGLAR